MAYQRSTFGKLKTILARYGYTVSECVWKGGGQRLHTNKCTLLGNAQCQASRCWAQLRLMHTMIRAPPVALAQLATCMPRAFPAMHGRSVFSVLVPAPSACCGCYRSKMFTKYCPQVLAAITAGCVAPLGETARSYFARKEIQARLADAMFNPRGSFVTITGAHVVASA